MIGWGDVPELLAWRRPDRLGDLGEARSALADRELGRALARLTRRDRCLASSVIETLESLEAEALRRVLDAPRTQACLTLCPPAHHVRYLREAVAAERARRGHAQWGQRQGVKSCEVTRAEAECSTCSLLVSEGQRRTGAPGGSGVALWTCTADQGWDVATGEEIRQHELVPGVVLDVLGPAVTGRLPDIPGDAGPLGQESAERVRRTATSGLLALAAVAPGARSLVTTMTRTVVARRDPSSLGACAACSSLAIGQTVLRNPQAELVDEAWLVEALIHESVHALIDVLQQSQPLLIDQEAGEARVASPWTGRSLDLDTYLQACWVWYSLAWAWADVTAAGEDGFASVAVRSRGMRAARGFWAGDVRETLGGLRRSVNPDVLDALGAAQQRLGTIS